MSLSQLVETIFPRLPQPLDPQFESARVAGEKRQMERRLRAGGLSATEAKKAVSAHFRQGIKL